jgi:hypothetical protein
MSYEAVRAILNHTVPLLDHSEFLFCAPSASSIVIDPNNQSNAAARK